ncbi:hypothetical protein [Arenibaculum pallidiluteum]|uniref:hypothetical protein n=1 Tax=Arenibaculum pallidiluteum TaxID=2812559 RepID=UPI001A976832|nr:hypothetical protein [Arenibaculum pallidiluteum]
MAKSIAVRFAALLLATFAVAGCSYMERHQASASNTSDDTYADLGTDRTGAFSNN